MEKRFLILILLLILAIGAFGATTSGNAGYIVRYVNNNLVEAIKEVNSSTLSLSNDITAKVKFTLTQSKSISNYFSQNCDSPAFSQSSMADLYFNELYLEYSNQNISVLAGKYYTSWGTSPVFNVVNLIEPYDFTNIFDSPVKESVSGIQTIFWYQNGSSLEVDLIPIFSPDVLSILPSTSVQFLEPSLSNVQFGVRYSTFVGNYNFYLDLYHGFDHAYSVKLLDNIPTFYNAPLNAIGAEFSGPFLLNQNYNFYGEGMVTYQNAKINFNGSLGINGYIFGQNMGVELERGLPGQNMNEPENAISMYTQKNLSRFLSINTFASYGFTDLLKTGLAVNIYLKYMPTQNLSIKCGGNFYAGNGEYYASDSNDTGIYVDGKIYF